ncbi:MAG TPA: hypothetical protein VIJ95_11535 [Hanamia sp.]
MIKATNKDRDRVIDILAEPFNDNQSVQYFLFVIVYSAINNLEIAKNLLVLPVLYALWIIYSILKAIKYKYRNNFSSKESKEEVTVLFFIITPWIGLPGV